MIRALFFCLMLWPVAVIAGPAVSEKISYYTVAGSNFADLRREMVRRGERGFWGFTKWRINWTTRCQVDLDISITLPRLARNARLSPADRRIWDAMVAALKRHEKLHAEHGRRAAEEIHRTKCENPRSVIRKWAAQERELDRVTRHGATQGVVLPD